MKKFLIMFLTNCALFNYLDAQQVYNYNYSLATNPTHQYRGPADQNYLNRQYKNQYPNTHAGYVRHAQTGQYNKGQGRMNWRNNLGSQNYLGKNGYHGQDRAN